MKRRFKDAFKVFLLTTITALVSGQDATIPGQGLSAISKIRPRLFQSYLNWFAYKYDGLDGASITDGGNNLFDIGNRISINSTTEVISPVIYNQYYEFDDFEFQSEAENPFVALMWVNNETRRRDVTIQVAGNIGADGKGLSQNITGSVRISDYYLHYKTFQVYGATSIPNLLEVFFIVYNRNIWNSEIDAEGFDVIIRSNREDINALMAIKAGEGSYRNVMAGYTLLSRYPTSLITKDELERFMLLLLHSLSSVPVNPTDLPIVAQSLSAIANFISPISQAYSGWYNYTYDGSDGSSINDGGLDMFDGGNQITVSDNSYSTSVVYNNYYSFNDFEFQSEAASPFIWLLWVNNEPRRRNVLFQTTGTARSRVSLGAFTEISGTIQIEDYRLRYNGFQLSKLASRISTSWVQIYFVVYNGNIWNSEFSNQDVTALIRSGSYNLDDKLIVEAGEGKLRNAMVGYTLLSRLLIRTSYGRPILSSEIEIALNRMLQAIIKVDLNQEGTSIVARGLSAIGDMRASIVGSYSGWYNYGYDGSDGINIGIGRSIFTVGNQISITSFNSSTIVEYNRFYKFNGLDFQSQAMHPFVSLAWVNNQTEQRKISVSVTGNAGSDGTGTTHTLSSSVQFTGYHLRYSTFQLYGAGTDPNILYVYFTIYNNNAWSSEVGQNVAVFTDSETDNLYHYLLIEAGDGKLRNVIVGFTLLSRYPTSHITSNEIRDVMILLLQAVSTIDTTPANVDECTHGAHDCHVDADCENTLDSFNCSCHSGYYGNGIICTDIDECNGNASFCGEAALCINTEGGFMCSCADGYTGDGLICEDTNECIEDKHDCGNNSTCTNEIGSYNCSCNFGYSGDGNICTDIDECNTNTSACGEATCINTEGSFSCSCNDGFMKNGTTCQDVDECNSGLHDCAKYSKCTNAEGSFSCSCNVGFYGDGRTCTDINECTESLSNCGENAICNNTEGSFTCSCFESFTGDGITCVETSSIGCYAEYMTVTVIADYYTNEGVGLRDIHLRDESCTGVVHPSSPNLWLFNTTSLTSCLNSIEENSTHIIYTNTITNVGPKGVYHRDPLYNTFSCIYKKDLEDVSLFSFSYGVIKNLKNITAPDGFGKFSTELNLYTDDTYTTPENRTRYKASDALHVMVKLGATHPDLTLVIERCWITATPDLNDQSQYTFIENGCPVSINKEYIKITASGVGRSASFESPAFGFIDYDITYLHCSMRICSLDGGNTCEPNCSLEKRSLIAGVERRKRQVNSDTTSSDIETLSVGPFKVIREKPDGNNPLPTSSLIAILAAVVIIVIALLVFAGVWFRIRHQATTKNLVPVTYTNPAKMQE